MNKKRINGNKIMWVEYWVKQAHPSVEANIVANQYDSYRWICEIDLPLINKKVTSIAMSEVNAMVKTADKASKLIDEYMKSHPELVIENEFKNGHYEIIGDENGRFESLGLTSEARQREGKKMEKKMIQSMEVMKKAIAQLGRINGSTENLFIQVLDQSLFDDEMTIKEVLQKVNNKIEQDYKISSCAIQYLEEGNSVVAIGYTFPR